MECEDGKRGEWKEGEGREGEGRGEGRRGKEKGEGRRGKEKGEGRVGNMRLCLYICAFHIHVRVCDWGCVCIAFVVKSYPYRGMSGVG